MNSTTYIERRQELSEYFDRTAAKTWERLTSDAPVGRVRATVREGRDRMRNNLLSWLPRDMRGLHLLDAGCGTGALAMEAAQRGAHVTAIDISPTLVDLARQRTPEEIIELIDYQVGDMLKPEINNRDGKFDYIVSMDSLIHYRRPDMVAAIQTLSEMCRSGLLVTFAPRTVPLAIMHAVGRLIPNRSHRAPAIEPVSESALREGLTEAMASQHWRLGRSERVSGGFYISQALELVRTDSHPEKTQA
ncbi:MAG TPA: magnesium protoporphyrin IX methyltransferase [Xanthomonadales bacterium]|nr:magnesium protoporphyrin IX methyltransferase [Xanthomonadales bacterium]